MSKNIISNLIRFMMIHFTLPSISKRLPTIRRARFVFVLFVLILVGCVARSGQGVRFVESGRMDPPTLAVNGVNSGNFSFAFVGDIHLGGQETSNLRKILDEAKSFGDSFVVFLGDITDKGERTAMETVKSQVAEFGFSNKAIYVLGNHDVFGDGWTAWKDLFGASHFDVVLGNCHFIVVDTADGIVGESQTDWLEETLKRSNSVHKIVLSHYMPVVPRQRTYLRLSNQVESSALMKLLSRYGADAWLGGHYHSFVQERIGGVNYVVAGGAGGRRMEPIKENFYVRGIVEGNNLSFQMRFF